MCQFSIALCPVITFYNIASYHLTRFYTTHITPHHTTGTVPSVFLTTVDNDSDDDNNGLDDGQREIEEKR